MDELIRKQDAIDATTETFFVEYEDGDSRKEEKIITQTKAAIRDRIKALPPKVICCKDCKFARMTADGECKYCDIWFPDEKTYMPGDYYCGSAERKEEAE